MTNTTYSVAGLTDAVRRELQNAPGMPGTFDDGAKWALSNVEGRASRADRLHALVNEDKTGALEGLERDIREQASGAQDGFLLSVADRLRDMIRN
jgi:hypothetical protein